MEVFGYRKLIAYQKAKEVVKKTYKLPTNLPTLNNKLKPSNSKLTTDSKL